MKQQHYQILIYRHHFILLKKPLENVSLICVRFNVPIEVCKYRNSLREGRAKVPEDVINKMYQRYSYPILHPARHQQWCVKFEEVWEVDAAGDTRKYASWRTD